MNVFVLQETFLPRIQADLRERADVALTGVDSWHSVVGNEEQKQLGQLTVLIICN